jgi:hypothetical protein
MTGIAQLGIAFSALGMVLTFMGLFPGVTGIEPGRGVGIVQYTAIYLGFVLLHLGALVYVKFTLYLSRPSNFAQQIGIRLTLTGLLLLGLAGLADFLGFGSHIPSETTDVVLGPLQGGVIVGGLLIASLGVLLYAITGGPPQEKEDPG